MNILFVCLGNICRSPIAQGIFEDILSKDEILKNKIQFVDSAGTAGYHIGKAPDSRMRETAKQYGFDIDHLLGRQAEVNDFSKFDYIYAMDSRNLENLLKICPAEYKHKVSLFLSDYNAIQNDEKITDVPDPFHGSMQDFNDVLNLIRNGAEAIANTLAT